MTRTAWLLAVAVAVGACGAPRPLEERPADRVAVPTSSVHYRAYDGADALAEALRYTPDAPVLVSAHRGGPVPGLVENSLEAFENTLNVTAALIETDVRRTADGVFVLMHDETLDRTTTGTGRVDEQTLAEIRALRLVTPDSVVTSFRVPTLAEALAWAEHRAVLLLDVKDETDIEAVAQQVRRVGADDRTVLIVYSLGGLAEARRVAPGWMVSVVVETPDDWAALLSTDVSLDRVIAFTGVGVPDRTVTAALHARGVRAQVGTFRVDAGATPETYDSFLDAGADVLATDNVRAATIAAQRATLGRRQQPPR